MPRNPLETDQTEDPRLDGGWPATVETGRTTALEMADHLEGVASTRLAARTAELARLTRKHGDTHPRVLEQRARLAADAAQHAAWTGKLAEARAAASVPTKADAWCVHGFVQSDDGKGVPRLPVVIVADRGAALEQLGESVTDAHGYFRVEHAIDRPAPTAAAPTVERKQFFVRALNHHRKPLYTDPAPVRPAAGEIEFRVLMLPANAEV